MSGGEEILLVISNLIYIIPAIVAWKWGFIALFAVLIAIGFLFSPAYHLCGSFDVCIYSYRVHKILDYIPATLSIALASLLFIYWRDSDDISQRGVGYPWLQKLFVFYFIVLSTGLNLISSSAMIAQGTIFGISAFIIFGYWFVYFRTHGTFPRYEWKSLFIGVSLITASLLMFVVNDLIPSYYWATHPLWHILGALGLTFVIMIRPPVPKYLNSESSIYSATNGQSLIGNNVFWF